MGNKNGSRFAVGIGVKKGIVAGLLAALLAVVVGIGVGCEPQKETLVEIFDGADRYAVTPVSASGKSYRTDHSFFGEDYNGFYLYLGQVKNVPISFGTAKQYHGETPLALSYASADATKESVDKANEEGITAAVKVTVHNAHKEGGKVVSAEGNSAFTGVLASMTVLEGYDKASAAAKENGVSVSTTDTYTSFKIWQQTNAAPLEATVGKNNEKAGFYRYTLFAACDVYALLVHDLTSDIWAYDFTSFARPETYCTLIEHSENDVFTAKANAAQLTFDSAAIDEAAFLEPPPIEEKLLNYAGSEVLSIGEVTIAADVRSIRIIGNPGKTYNMNFVIAARTLDLKITLVDMKFFASPNKSAIEDKTESGKNIDDARHTVRIVLQGDNLVIGGRGINGINFSPAYTWNSVKSDLEAYARANGVLGSTGACGINLGYNNLTVMGDGKLTVTGGAGGSSGVFEELATTLDGKIENQGFDGASGGSGIYSYLVNFDDAISENILVTGGAGGSGSDPGICASGANDLRFVCNGGNGGAGIQHRFFVNGEINCKFADVEPLGGAGGKGGAAQTAGAGIFLAAGAQGLPGVPFDYYG